MANKEKQNNKSVEKKKTKKGSTTSTKNATTKKAINNSNKKTVAKKEVKPKVEIKEEMEKVEPSEQMADIFDGKNLSTKSDILKLLGNIIFWSIFIILAFVWITDFVRVSREKTPKYCLVKETHFFEDGTVEECVGLGYKVYKYDRKSLKSGMEFGPFFIDMKNEEND